MSVGGQSRKPPIRPRYESAHLSGPAYTPCLLSKLCLIRVGGWQVIAGGQPPETGGKMATSSSLLRGASIPPEREMLVPLTSMTTSSRSPPSFTSISNSRTPNISRSSWSNSLTEAASISVSDAPAASLTVAWNDTLNAISAFRRRIRGRGYYPILMPASGCEVHRVPCPDSYRR